MSVIEFKKYLLNFVANKEAFLFLIDFKWQRPFICRLEEAEKHGILYDIKGFSNIKETQDTTESPQLSINPLDRATYAKAFQTVMSHIQDGDTYLLNLAFPTKIQTNLSLRQLFEVAKAPYKIYKEDEFVSFSPECFIQIKNDHIYSYPMKGTIDATIEEAAYKLRTNSKELWEHNTIVDLIRNDLAMVASEVRVTKYRYFEKIKTNRNELLQTSSEIRGKLPNDWKKNLADILFQLLPAGSISGAPKQKTVEIIETIEKAPRNFYTGIFGLFTGTYLDSAVAIRFIEQIDGALFYKSGGGITFMSQEEEEYRELIHKIYVPTI